MSKKQFHVVHSLVHTKNNFQTFDSKILVVSRTIYQLNESFLTFLYIQINPSKCTFTDSKNFQNKFLNSNKTGLHCVLS